MLLKAEDFCEAEACRQASAKARPKMRDPVRTTWVMIRWACDGAASQRKLHKAGELGGTNSIPLRLRGRAEEGGATAEWRRTRGGRATTVMSDDVAATAQCRTKSRDGRHKGFGSPSHGIGRMVEATKIRTDRRTRAVDLGKDCRRPWGVRFASRTVSHSSWRRPDGIKDQGGVDSVSACITGTKRLSSHAAHPTVAHASDPRPPQSTPHHVQ